MEIQLNELIDQIKREGVEAAEGKAESILNSAKQEAEKIISSAKETAEKIIAAAEKQNERMVKSSEDAIRQAGRNLLISLRESVTKELNGIIGEEVSAVYSDKALFEIIVKVITAWSENNEAESLTVLLNEADLNILENSLISALKEKAIKGVTFKPNDNFNGGFRISVNNSGAYYDYSSESVVEMLSSYLSPRVTELLKEAE